MNNNISDKMRQMSSLLMACADEIDNAFKEYDSRTTILEQRLAYEEQKHKHFMEGLRDLVSECS